LDEAEEKEDAKDKDTCNEKNGGSSLLSHNACTYAAWYLTERERGLRSLGTLGEFVLILVIWAECSSRPPD
jgi:hypothetical protein